MTVISLTNVPNQMFSVNTPGGVVGIRLHTFRNLLYCDISNENEPVIRGIRCITGQWILPKYYAASVGGNFRFETTASKYPTYEEFESGMTSLCFYTTSEIANGE